MKKLLAAIIALMAILLISIPVFADNKETPLVETLAQSEIDLQEIEKLKLDIIRMINSTLKYENKENLPLDLSLNLSESIKIYMDQDTVDQENNTVNNLINKNEYIWLYTFTYQGMSYQVNISKGLPPNKDVEFTDEELNWIKENEGKWVVVAVNIREGEVSYQQIINDSLEQNGLSGDEVYLIGGVSHIYQPVAVTISNGEADLLIPTAELDIEGTTQQKRSVMARGLNTEEQVYKFDKIKQAINNMPTLDDEYSGGSYIILTDDILDSNFNFGIILLISGGVMVFGFAVVYLVRKKNHSISK